MSYSYIHVFEKGFSVIQEHHTEEGDRYRPIILPLETGGALAVSPPISPRAVGLGETSAPEVDRNSAGTKTQRLRAAWGRIWGSNPSRSGVHSLPRTPWPAYRPNKENPAPESSAGHTPA